jgi:hypothetical protein
VVSWSSARDGKLEREVEWGRANDAKRPAAWPLNYAVRRVRTGAGKMVVEMTGQRAVAFSLMLSRCARRPFHYRMRQQASHAAVLRF